MAHYALITKSTATQGILEKAKVIQIYDIECLNYDTWQLNSLESTVTCARHTMSGPIQKVH